MNVLLPHILLALFAWEEETIANLFAVTIAASLALIRGHSLPCRLQQLGNVNSLLLIAGVQC